MTVGGSPTLAGYMKVNGPPTLKGYKIVEGLPTLPVGVAVGGPPTIPGDLRVSGLDPTIFTHSQRVEDSWGSTQPPSRHVSSPPS